MTYKYRIKIDNTIQVSLVKVDNKRLGILKRKQTKGILIQNITYAGRNFKNEIAKNGKTTNCKIIYSLCYRNNTSTTLKKLVSFGVCQTWLTKMSFK